MLKYKSILLLAVFGFAGFSLFATSTITTWMKDMYNQPAVKPQGQGTVLQFPENSISVGGIQNRPAAVPFSSKPVDLGRYRPPENRVKNFVYNPTDGEQLFYTYCTACHGLDGRLNNGSGSMLSLKGLKVKPMIVAPAGFYYDRLTRGGVQMPPLGFRMSDRERWNLSHFIAENLSTLSAQGATNRTDQVRN